MFGAWSESLFAGCCLEVVIVGGCVGRGVCGLCVLVLSLFFVWLLWLTRLTFQSHDRDLSGQSCRTLVG